MRMRTRSRELALQTLYQVDLRGTESWEEIDEMLRASGKSDEVCDFARTLVGGTLLRLEEVDRLIAGAAEHWDIARMAAIDRNVLRMAVYEMLELPDIPRKVSINEAIELGKRFSTEQSGAFVNGILDRIRRNLDDAERR